MLRSPPVLSLRWIVLSSRWPLRTPSVNEALLACRARPRHPTPPPPPPSGTCPKYRNRFSAHLLATFRLLFTLAWAIRRRLLCQTRVSIVPCVVVVVVVMEMDRKRKDQLLEALFRASLGGASRLEMKGRPARKAGSTSIGNKNKTHKTAVEGSRTAFAR